MKHIQNTARNIFLMDDEATFGSVLVQNEQHQNEQAEDKHDQIEQVQTAPIDSIPYKITGHPLRGLLTSALSLIASRPDVSQDPSFHDFDADELTRHDDLIALYDDEEDTVESDSFSTAVSVLDSITDSLRGGEDAAQDDGVKTPLFLSAFKSRFLR